MDRCYRKGFEEEFTFWIISPVRLRAVREVEAGIHDPVSCKTMERSRCDEFVVSEVGRQRVTERTIEAHRSNPEAIRGQSSGTLGSENGLARARTADG